MFTDVKQYREALSLMDDPEVEPDLRAELADNVRYFEHDYPDVAKRAVADLTGDEDAIAEQRMLGAVPQSSRVETSREGQQRAGLKRPRTREEYFDQSALLRSGDLGPEEKVEAFAGQQDAFEGGGIPNISPELTPTLSPDPAERALAVEEWKRQQAEQQGEEPTPVQDARAKLEEDYQEQLRKYGFAGINPQQANASKSTDANLSAPPEYLPQGASFSELLQTQPWLEPPLDIVKEIFRRQGHHVEKMTEQDPRYQRFADAAWTAEYKKAKAEGRPLVRLAYMSGGDWKKQAYKAQAIALNEFAGPFAAGVDKSLTFGLATEALSGMMGEDTRKALKNVTEAHPVAAGAGQVVGAFAPGGLAARTYGGVARTIAPAAGSGIGRRLLGAGAAAATTASTESVASDLVHNAGEAAFMDNPRYTSMEDMARRAGTSAVSAVPFGIGGEILGSLAGAGVKALREGRRGKALADLEQAGLTTGGVTTVGQAGRLDIPGLRPRNDPLQKAVSEAALKQRDVEDVLSDPVVRGLTNRELAGLGDGVETSAVRGGDLRTEVLNFRKRPGQEAKDLDLLERAQQAGVADELLLLPALRGMRELQSATPSPGVSLGSGLYSYVPNAAGAIGTRLDPAMRALAMRESAPAAGHSLRAADISEDLLHFIRGMVGMRRPARPGRPGIINAESRPMAINPLRDIAEGRAGLFSARQFGASGAPQEQRRTKFTQLTSAEQDALVELMAALQRNGQLPAAVGE